MFMKSHALGLAAIIVFVTACAAPVKVDKPRSQMSQREKDSVIAASGLPGSGVVKKALRMSDQQERDRIALDSASKEN